MVTVDEELKRVLGEFQFQVAVLRAQNAALVAQNRDLQEKLSAGLVETEPPDAVEEPEQS